MVFKDCVVSGEPARIVTGMSIPGNTIKQKMDYFEEHHDGLRQEWTVGENHQGAVLVDPTEGGEVGAIFFNADGYPNMCGHLSMAIGSAYGYKTIDTSAGQVKVREAEGLTAFTNVPCFYHSLIESDIPALGLIPVHLVFSGDFFLLVNVARLHLPFLKDNLSGLVEMALHIFWHLKSRVKVFHPLRPWIDHIDVIMLYQQISEKGYATLTAWGKDEYDLCPCGTGTSALAAMLYYFGLIKLGEKFTNRSLAGGEFEASIVSTEEVVGMKAVVPEVFGKVIGG